MKYNRVDMLGSRAAAGLQQGDIRTVGSVRQHSKPRTFRRAGACAGTVGAMLLFLSGVASTPPVRPGPPYGARPVVLAAVRSPSKGSGQSGDVQTHRTANHVHHVNHGANVHVVHHVYHGNNVHIVHRVYPAGGPIYVGYPTAGPWYPYYPYPGPYVTYTNVYYPYPYYPYQYYPYYMDLTAQGYQDGLHRGQDDAEDHRSYDPYRKGFQYPGSVTYSNGFLQGYAVGYGPY